MLHPSYTDLMKVVNKDVKEGEKPLSIAIEELNKGELKIKAESAAEEE